MSDVLKTSASRVAELGRRALKHARREPVTAPFDETAEVALANEYADLMGWDTPLAEQMAQFKHSTEGAPRVRWPRTAW